MSDLYPSREQLMIGAACLALKHLHSELRQSPADAAEIKCIALDVSLGKEVATRNIAINDCLVHARQALRVSLEEWERVVKVRCVRQEVQP